ncbi:MAG: YkgJ family cysteine cluster protein [Cyclobacteriaceae bacterium]|nr:YkgJ family cysteine cluster protein [Cyclobacteriaceae bacterium]
MASPACSAMDLERFKEESGKKAKANKKYLAGLKRLDPRKVDSAFHAMHDEVFESMDCLDCANCCKTTSPIFYEADIGRAAKALRIKPGDFVEKYLRVDEDKDYVLKAAPCPFLDGGNYCGIYESRPKACREYPHTNRKKMVQVMDLAYKNTLVCPAVLEIVERLRKSGLGK